VILNLTTGLKKESAEKDARAALAKVLDDRNAALHALHNAAGGGARHTFFASR
jgi:hypothetical protein